LAPRPAAPGRRQVRDRRRIDPRVRLPPPVRGRRRGRLRAADGRGAAGGHPLPGQDPRARRSDRLDRAREAGHADRHARAPAGVRGRRRAGLRPGSGDRHGRRAAALLREVPPAAPAAPGHGRGDDELTQRPERTNRERGDRVPSGADLATGTRSPLDGMTRYSTRTSRTYDGRSRPCVWWATVSFERDDVLCTLLHERDDTLEALDDGSVRSCDSCNSVIRPHSSPTYLLPVRTRPGRKTAECQGDHQVTIT